MTSETEKRCQEKDCGEILDANNFVSTQTGGCSISTIGYYCSRCGRLHWWNGPEPMFGKGGKKLFFKKGKITAL